ncbi:MAG TPA: glycosyl transferase family 1 [Bacteroides sp.]|nr:glycosyl transferase family 1 [Bacteroides sp.]
MKRVLIITYYWPPSGGVSVHRCLKFAKYLRRFGWEPVVYAPRNAHYPYLDESMMKDIPDGIDVIKGSIIEPFQFFKLITGRKLKDPMINPIHARNKKPNFLESLSIWIRGNFFIPDARSLWIRPSVRRLSRYIREKPVDAIFSDGPPHTNTVIACRLANKFNIPWLADFQDPWTQVDYYELFPLSKKADKKHKKLEQETFQTAGKITIASPTWKKDLEMIGARNVDVLYYGYDEDDFQGLDPSPYDQFTISHAGILGYDRNPENVFRALNEFISENPDLEGKIRILLAGVVDMSVKKSVTEHGLEKITDYLGTVSKPEAIKMTLKSHVLLLPLNRSANIKGRMPGKFYEYLRADRNILALGPTDSDVGKILSESTQGKCVNYEDFSAIREHLKLQIDQYLEGVSLVSRTNVEAFSVEVQTSKLAGYLDELIK